MTYFEGLKAKGKLTRKGIRPHAKTRQPRPGRGRPARWFDEATGTWTPPRQRVAPVAP